MKFKLFLFAFAAIGSLFSLTALAQTYAITNAKIVTVSGENIEKGTVVIRDGLIEAVGSNAKVPADARVFDANGLTVYPGFIDTLTSQGLPSAPAQAPRQPGGGPQIPQQTAPTSNSNYPDGLQPEKTAFEDLKAGEAQFEATRNAGFTTVLTVGRTGIFNGQSAIIDLAGDSVSAMTVKSPFAQHVSFTTLRGFSYPNSLLGTFSAFRQMLLDAKRLQELEKMYQANPKGMKRPDSDKSLEALFPIINGTMPVVFNANNENEIVRALNLAKEFNLKAIIAGGQEAWKVSDRLKKENVSVLLSLNFPKRTASASPEADPETLEILRFRAETPKTASKLAIAGVPFAFQTGGGTTADYFANALKSIESGLSKESALKAMTLGAAQILGVSDRLGSIEAGKIANLTVVKGDLFGKEKTITHVFVDGKLFELKEPPKRPEGAPNQPPPTGQPAVANVGGNYAINIDIPGQSLTGTLALTQQGSQLSGSMQTQLGNSVIKDGKVTADGFSFSTSVQYGGSTFDINVSGKVTGNQISGIIDSPQGSIPFSGTKNP